MIALVQFAHFNGPQVEKKNNLVNFEEKKRARPHRSTFLDISSSLHYL